jgi:glutamate racemase
MNMAEKQELSIGIFDSGVGGLTVMKQLMNHLPHERLIYFGDTARMPYGEKSQNTIIRYAIDNAIFLMEQNIKLLVVACNTASAFAKEKLKRIFKIPIVDVIEPGAEKAIQVTRNGRIAVLGTKGTILSGAYQTEIQKKSSGCAVFSVACPLLASLIEEKFIQHPATRLIVKEYLTPFLDKGIDTVLLGCTHYPLIKHLIQEEWGPNVTVVDSASTCAEKVASILQEKEELSKASFLPEYKFFVSDDPKKFRSIGEEFLGSSIQEVLQASASLSH